VVQIIWTNRARKDLRQISEYISRDSAVYAQNQINRIYKKTEILIQLTLVGKVVRGVNDRSIREVIEGNYRIIYRITKQKQIDILAVHHGARSLRKRKLE